MSELGHSRAVGDTNPTAIEPIWMTPYHFSDQQMYEVDIVLERDDGMIAGIEVKASATVIAHDFAGLDTFAEACQDKFARGVVLF